MSAESHQKRAPSTSSDAARMMPNIVPPQPVSDRSILDSVAGFINDVALTNTPQTDPKDHILWVKFENLADISDTCLGEDWDVEGNMPPPLLLCIGYGSGVQVWAIPANGEAIEVMSWKHGAVKVLRILPTPFLTNNSELASDLLDQFIHKRPLMGLCGDCPTPNQPPSQQSQQFHAVNFVSLKDGDVVKSIRFKSPIVDIVANRTSIAVTFAERIAIFDARTLEDRLTVTTCYPCPGGLCPIALGDRWLAYAEKKLIPSKASAGGCFSDGVGSYTATVLNAAKSLGKGLRELGEQVAAGLTGSASNISSQGPGSSSSSTVNADGTQPGIVTILDIKHAIKDISPTSGTPVAINGNDPIVAHFLAHPEAITAMSFDPSGMLLVTADRRGHDFNVFRIQPHPSGSVLAAAHHLYVLHRGDTSAKVQDITFSFDSRWVAVSSLRGTTHVFPITPYGGQPGYRTHSAPHVVNRLSRFHRSAGLSVDGRASSPILMAEHAVHSTAYANPRLPPFPHPTVVLPLAQLRQPSSLSSASSLTSLSSPQGAQQGSKGHLHSRQRHHSSTEESHSKPLRVAAVFAKARSWLLDPPGLAHETPSRLHRRPVDSLFVIAGHGALIQYDLDPRHIANVPKEKVCDETPIELEVEAKAQWNLGSRSNSHMELSPPLPSDNWLIKDRVIDNNLNLDTSQMESLRTDQRDDRWLSQVEIVTHAGPHRRLWMGPQFIFKTYNTPSGNSLAHIDVESVEIGALRARSTPMNMPLHQATSRPLVPVLIESGSCSSHEQSPRLTDSFHYESIESDVVMGPESQLKEDLADAMRDCAAVPIGRDSANDDASCKLTCDLKTVSYHSSSSDGGALPSTSNLHTVVVSIVNPQGTVTTVTNNPEQLLESFSSDNYIHENCDETMFRPVVTVMSDPKQRQLYEDAMNEEVSQPIEMPLQLIVPVIDERMVEQKKKERELEQKKIEQAERDRKQEEADSSRAAVEEEKQKLEAEKAFKEEEVKRKLEAEKAQKKLEEKRDEAVSTGALKKGKKAQKYNKRPSEPEKKPVERKEKAPTPPKASPVEEKLVEVAKVQDSLDIADELSIEKVESAAIAESPAEAELPVAPEEAPLIDIVEPKEKSPEPEIIIEAKSALKEKSPAPKPPALTKALKEKSPTPQVEEPKALKDIALKQSSIASEKRAMKEARKALKESAAPLALVEKEIVQIEPTISPVKVARKEAPVTAKESVSEVAKESSAPIVKESSPEATKEFPAAPEIKASTRIKEQKLVATEKPAKAVAQAPPVKEKTVTKEPTPADEPPPTAWKSTPFVQKSSPIVSKELSVEIKEPPPPAPALLDSKPLDKPEPQKPEQAPKKNKKGKKNYSDAKWKQEKISLKVEDDFPVLEPLPALEPLPPLEDSPIEDYRAIDKDAIMKISKHEPIGDDEIDIVPLNSSLVIQDNSDVVIIEEHFTMPGEEKPPVVQQDYIKNEDFYDIDDDLPPLEPLESFDVNFEPLCYDETPIEKETKDEDDEQKKKMKKKMSELLKDTNLIFAMCSSLKEIADDDDSKSMNSSQIQRSTSSSLTTNTTTSTFASASSNQTGECQDSDYKSLELDLDEQAGEAEFKVPGDLKANDDAEDISSLEATSSETDDSSSKPSDQEVQIFKREDDEELRPLLQTSITSLSSPVDTSATTNTTEANDTSTLPETNQKSSSQATSNNGNKRKNKKKRR